MTLSSTITVTAIAKVFRILAHPFLDSVSEQLLEWRARFELGADHSNAVGTWIGPRETTKSATGLERVGGGPRSRDRIGIPPIAANQDGVPDSQEHDDDERSRQGRSHRGCAGTTVRVPKLRGTHFQPPEASRCSQRGGHQLAPYLTLLHSENSIRPAQTQKAAQAAAFRIRDEAMAEASRTRSAIAGRVPVRPTA